MPLNTLMLPSTAPRTLPVVVSATGPPAARARDARSDVAASALAPAIRARRSTRKLADLMVIGVSPRIVLFAGNCAYRTFESKPGTPCFFGDGERRVSVLQWPPYGRATMVVGVT